MKLRHLDLRDVTVRSATDLGPAYIEGTAVPYDVDINYMGQVERFAADSIDAATVVGRPLLYGHNYTDPDAWLGTIVDAENAPTGLIISAEVIDSGMARKLRDATRPPGLSVGVQIDAAVMNDDDSVTYQAATLRELSITTVPAYGDDSMIAAVRHIQQSEEDTMTEAAAPTVTREAPVDLTPLTDRLDQIEARMHTAAAPARVLDVRSAFELALADAAKTRQTRALADVVSSGNAGVLPEQWTSEVRGYLDSMRYLMAAAGSVAFPSAGYTLTVPKITQRTLVGARGAEKSEVPSQALTTGSDTYTAAWYAGAVDIALELIMQSDPSILSIVSQDLLSQYAVATESAFVTAAEAAATAEGGALDTSSYGALVADLIGTNETIRAATGAPGDRLALTTDSWAAVLGLVDADDRRIFATGGSAAADGSAALTARSVNIGGVQAFHSPGSTVDLQFNDKSLRVAEKPPTQLSMDNVALMGRDVGVLGAIITLPLYPAGIIKYSA